LERLFKVESSFQGFNECISQIAEAVMVYPEGKETLPNLWGEVKDLFNISGWCPKV